MSLLSLFGVSGFGWHCVLVAGVLCSEVMVSRQGGEWVLRCESRKADIVQ